MATDNTSLILGELRKGQKELDKRVGVIFEKLDGIQKAIGGTGTNRGIHGRITTLEDWREEMVPRCDKHMKTSSRRTWAVVLAIASGVGVWISQKLYGS